MKHTTKTLAITTSIGLLAVIAGCQTPMPTASMTLGAQGQNGYGVLSNVPAASTNGACGGQCFTVYAGGTGVFSMSGTHDSIEGDAHTNGNIKISGNHESITGNGEAVSGISISGSQNTVGTPNPGAAPCGAPVAIDASSFTPTFSFTGDVNLNSVPSVWAKKGQLKPGVYVATGTLSIPGNGVSGNVTLIANSIQLSGNNHNLTPFAQGVLCDATGGDIKVAGANGAYQGLFDAANGSLSVSGHSNAIAGMCESGSFDVTGSLNTFNFKDFGYCPTPAPTPTPVPTPTCTPTPTPVPATPTPTPTPTPAAATPTPVPTGTPIPSPTPMPASPTPTPTPSGSVAPSTPSPTPSATPTSGGGTVGVF